MKRRGFIRRCMALGVARVLVGQEAVGQSLEDKSRTKSLRNRPASVLGTIDGGADNALTYLGSFATPTLTDTYVKPAKKAKVNFGKHTKLTYCPANGLIYICGGDGQGQHWGGNDSGTIDTVATYDVTTHDYKEDFLYRGYVGEPVPRGLDFIAFTWAPSLKEFWLGPGYGWNYTREKYPWLDFSWSVSHYASYNPATRKFTARGPRTGRAFAEGFAGSWDTRRDRLVWVENQAFHSLNPSTNVIISEGLGVSSHRTETADTWYYEVTDELYFVQLATGKVYAYHIGKKLLRPVADTGVTANNASSYAVVYLTESRYCLIVYDELVGGARPWKLVNLATGAVQHLNLFAPGCTNHNTGVYHPPTKTIVLTGGSNDGNYRNGGAWHHYKSNL